MPQTPNELIRLIRRIQALTLELRELEQHEPRGPEVAAKARLLEQLRWRPATVARRTALGELGTAA